MHRYIQGCTTGLMPPVWHPPRHKINETRIQPSLQIREDGDGPSASMLDDAVASASMLMVRIRLHNIKLKLALVFPKRPCSRKLHASWHEAVRSRWPLMIHECSDLWACLEVLVLCIWRCRHIAAPRPDRDANTLQNLPTKSRALCPMGTCSKMLSRPPFASVLLWIWPHPSAWASSNGS